MALERGALRLERGTLRPDLILFDLDGTLSDPLEGFARSMNHALTHFGYAARAPGEFAPYVGPPIEDAFRELTGRDDKTEITALIARYRERYADIGYTENTLYPGVPGALEGLRAAGIALGVCTTKRRDFAEKILTLFDLRQHFRFVSGGDVGIAKWQQIAALRAGGEATTNSLMVGDRAVDLTAAQRNGLAAAGVLWGYGSHAELAAHAPRHLFAAPGELARLAG